MQRVEVGGVRWAFTLIVIPDLILGVTESSYVHGNSEFGDKASASGISEKGPETQRYDCR